MKIYKIRLESLDNTFIEIFIKLKKHQLDENIKTLMSGLFGMMETDSTDIEEIFNQMDKVTNKRK